MTKKLKTLKASNSEVFKNSIGFGKPILNGIECPNCKKELFDSRPNIILTSSPAQKDVHCDNCGYVGYRFV